MKQSLNSFSLINIDSHESKFRETKRRWLLVKYHKQIFDSMLYAFEQEKFNLGIVYEALKQLYSTMECAHVQLPRNILQFIGSVILNRANLQVLNDLISALMFCIENIDMKNRIDYVEFLNQCTDYYSTCDRILKLDFKLRNRLTIINNYEL